MAEDTDFNDLAGKQGLRPVKAAIDRAIDAARGIPYGRYRVTATAVMMQTETKDGAPEERPLCTRLLPVGIARTAAGNSYALVTEMTDLDGRQKTWTLPQEQIYRSGGEEARIQFVNLGGAFFPGTREKSEFHDLLKSFLRAADNLPRITLADRCGWITRGAAAAYVMPERTIGTLGTEQVRVLDPGDGAPDYSAAGTLHEWQQHIGRYCAGNSRLVFACSLPLAAALLHPAGGEGGGFNLVGCSGSGKTTTLHVGASITGPPQSQIKSCDATGNAFEAAAAQHNDACLFMDELGQAPAEQIGQIAYKLSGGVGRGRADQHGNARSRRQWRVIFLTTGETDLTTMLASVGKRSFAGQELRLADVPADAGAGLGIFDTLHDFTAPAELAEHLKQAAGRYHGAIWQGYLTRLVAEMNDADQRSARLRWVTEAMQQFRAAAVPAGASGQVHRVASRFALAAAGGELATLYGLTGWRAGEVFDGVLTCFLAWLERRGTAGTAEVEQLLQQVRAFFAMHGESRFSPMDGKKGRQPTLNRAGFRQNTADLLDDERWSYFVFPASYTAELCRGYDPRWCTQVLLERGLLQPGTDGRPQAVKKLPGSSKAARVYHFPDPLAAGEEAAD